MTIRRATEADSPALAGLRAAYNEEFWRRPFPPGPWRDEYDEGWHNLVAEDGGTLLGMASGSIDGHGTGRIHHIYVRPEARGAGTGRALLAELAAWFREQGAEHVTLGVDTTNETAQAVWRRLGFAEYARELTAPLDAFAGRLGRRESERSFGSVHVQTDDVAAVERAVQKIVPRLGRSVGTTVTGPRNGWTAVYDELCDREPKLLQRLAREVSNATGAVVLALGVEQGAVARYALFDRGGVVDEYLSVPEYYGPLPPRDVVALGANPTVLARLTGADPARVRAAARTASSPAELPPAPELLARLAEVLGVEGAEHGYADL